MLARIWENGTLICSPIENSMEVPQKTKNTTNILPSHTTAGHIFKGM
jgi:hypothetical protein